MQPVAAVLFLLSCFFFMSFVQSQGGERPGTSAWDDPIQFVTKAKDQCSMKVTGQGSLTKLRISCESQSRSYWCDYEGEPHICRPYNTNPRRFFTQIMWDLRKLDNACQGRSVLKTFMCQKAPAEAQMVFSSSSSSYDVPREHVKPDLTQANPRQDDPKSDQARLSGRKQGPDSQPTRSQPAKPNQAKADRRKRPHSRPTKQTKVVKPKTTSPQATTAPAPSASPSSTAKRLAQEHCWPSLQGLCGFVIGWFTN
ncbi:fibroblast growth factor binding protein 2a [Hoplias malabaricus]|uniref:fibroblast growth factor binding protein 2a n=1 Tax=Hoplias malabaricus TaxID=27720 RepID=UPI0034629EF2